LFKKLNSLPTRKQIPTNMKEFVVMRQLVEI